MIILILIFIFISAIYIQILKDFKTVRDNDTPTNRDASHLKINNSTIQLDVDPHTINF